MLTLLRRMLHLRPLDPSEHALAPTYEVACTCTYVLRGFRRASRQIAACPACGRKVFLLARSPLPSLEGGLSPGRAATTAAWRMPMLAGSATLAILVVVFLIFIPFLGRSTTPRKDEPPPDIQGLIAAGRSALADGDADLAAQKFQSILDLDQRRPTLLARSVREEAVQLFRQSDLLSRLSNRSIQEIVQEAELVRHDAEWKARFEKNYRGKAVLFDDTVRFDDKVHAGGRRRPVMTQYRISVGANDVQLTLEDLNVLQSLPLERGRRLLFGGRLSAVERGPAGIWVVRFDPDSGVLLTDRGAAEAVCPPLDADLLEVLKQQDEWIRRGS